MSLSHGNDWRGWQDWIFRESCLRVAYVYFILSLVLSADFGIRCGDDPADWNIEDLPLPAPKTAWDAEDKQAWATEVYAGLDGGPVPKFGALLARGEGSAWSAGCRFWQEGMDEIGLVVTMASQLPQQLKG